MTDLVSPVDCVMCNGSGWIAHDAHCPACDGTGEVEEDPFYVGADLLHERMKDERSPSKRKGVE